jgi:cell division protein FtsW
MTARTTTLPPPRRGGRAARPAGAVDERAAARARHPSARRPPGVPAPARRRTRLAARADRGPAPPAFYALALIVTLLTLLGLVMVLSATSVKAIHEDESPWLYFRRQLVWAALGGASLLLALRIPLAVWRRLVVPALVGSFVLMALPFLPGIGREVNGARAWVAIGPVGFQPSEFAKIGLLLYVADLFARREDRMHLPRATLGPASAVLGALLALHVGQRDLGSAIVLAGIVLVVAFVAGSPLVPLLGRAAVLGLGGVVLVRATPYRWARWTAFLDLAAHKQDTGFQVWQARIGMASGGLTGLGIGASRAKWGFLPEAHTDFIFAILAEELGFAGVVTVCGLFVLLGVFGVQVAARAEDRFGLLVAGGITGWLLLQAFVNIAGVTGILPLTGITLPFVSFGGSSLLATMLAAGLLLNVARSPRTPAR